MNQQLILVLALFLPLALTSLLFLYRLWRGQIYRANDLNRDELNKMHRHTLFTVALCFVFLLVAIAFPSI